MSYIRRYRDGWRAEVDLSGIRKSKTGRTKAEVTAWAAAEEAAIRAGARGEFPARTLAEAFAQYEREVSARKRGSRAESLRFAAFERDFPELARKVLHTITTPDLVAWRDARRRQVSDSSVVREAAQLRNVWTVAAREWHWCGEPSPWRNLKLPAKAHARTRRTGWREVRALVRHMGYRPGVAPVTPQQQVAHAYMIAQHTALRAGEIQALKRSTVDLARRVVTLAKHKTVEAEGIRFVPITRKAARVLRVLDDAAKEAKRDAYFTISSASIDVLFRKVRDYLMLENLHFHDSRADALTRMARKMDVMTLARVSGHRDLRQLLDAYYRETAGEIAARI